VSKAQSKQAKRRRQAHQKASRSTHPAGIQVVPAPEKRLRGFFKVVDDITAAADAAAVTGDEEPTRTGIFSRAVFVRGINLLKASRILLAQGHWEVAASAARQLFELLVNMEYLAAQKDEEATWLRYQKFALLQQARRVLREIDYDRSTGRAVEDHRATFAHDMLQNPVFDDFRVNNGKWKASWSGLNTKSLTERSPDGMRVKQYELLFVTWSEETHAAPVALLNSMIPKSEASWIETQVAADDREVGQMIVMLVALFLSLHDALAKGPRIDVETRFGWTIAIQREIDRHTARPAPAEPHPKSNS